MNILLDVYDTFRNSIISEIVKKVLIDLREYFLFDRNENMINLLFIIDAILIKKDCNS